MKLSVAVLGFVLGGASAFAPSSNNHVVSKSALRMSEEAEVPLMEIEETVPCFGAAPWLGGELFVGENYWNKLTSDYGSEATGTFIRAAELKHCRSAMLATVGFAFHKLGITLDNISPHEYLSVTQGIKFSDLSAMTPLEAMKAVPPEGIVQMFAAISLVEIFEMTHKDGKLVEDASVPPGFTPGGLTGDLGWNPLGIKVTDRRRLVELQNGRAAMVAICAWVSHDVIADSFPLPLPWN